MDQITPDDIKFARAILIAMYGESFANSVRIDENSMALIAEMLVETESCTDSIDLVPSSPGYFAKPALSYVLKVIRKVGQEILIDPAKKTLIICNRVVFRSRQAAFIY